MNELNKNQSALLLSSFVYDNSDNGIRDVKIPFLNLSLV